MKSPIRWCSLVCGALLAVGCDKGTTIRPGGGAGGTTVGADHIGQGGGLGGNGSGGQPTGIANSCDGSPNAGCQCGFTIPNPIASGLPNPASYTVNADDTVTDNVTGLIWQRTLPASQYTLADAMTYCAAKGAGWRPPTRLELVTLFDFYGSGAPWLNHAIFPSTPGTIADTKPFLTTSRYAGDASNVWLVYYYFGETDVDGDGFPRYLRCVHPASAQKCFSSRFQSKAAGFVYDAATGLTWQQDVASDKFSLSGAQTYCASLGPSWRVPSLGELQSIVDETKFMPAIDQSIFHGTTNESFWSTSPDKHPDMPDSATYHVVSFGSGGISEEMSASALRVRCVR